MRARVRVCVCACVHVCVCVRVCMHSTHLVVKCWYQCEEGNRCVTVTHVLTKCHFLYIVANGNRGYLQYCKCVDWHGFSMSKSCNNVRD